VSLGVISPRGGAALVACMLTATAPAEAHQLDPMVLELDAQPDGTFLVAWSGPRAELEPAFDARCDWTAPRLDCGPRGLAGTNIRFEGRASAATEILVIIEDGGTTILSASDEAPIVAIPPTPPPATAIMGTYLLSGIAHILAGIDHLAFVLALMLIISTRRTLILTITAFTVAHSVTLVAAALGWLSFAAAPVEAAIAASIVLVAAEACHDRDTITRRAPYVAAMLFGLLHGLGFAGALLDAGLPAGDVPAALLAFNVGVELGQLAFVAAVGTLSSLVRPGPRLRTAVAYGIGSVAVAWTIERVGMIIFARGLL